MKYKILLLFILILLISGCNSPFSGGERVKAFELKCNEKNMTYDNGGFVPESVYDCIENKGEVHTFIMEW